MRLWNAQFTLLFIIQTCDILTYNMITPIVATFATASGATVIQAGAIASSFMIAAIVIRPLSGYISDRANRKRLILITVALGPGIGYMVGPIFGALVLDHSNYETMYLA